MTDDRRRLGLMQDALAIAIIAERRHRGMIATEREGAVAAVDERHRAETERLADVLAARHAAVAEAQATVSRADPLLGRRVHRPEGPSTGFLRAPRPAQTGIVRIHSAGDPTPRHADIPDGSLVIRILAKDGTEGRRLVEMVNGLPAGWTTADD